MEWLLGYTRRRELTKISVRKLFGRFNYDFDMGNMKKGIIILSGPNGFGKTVLLDCINAISMSDLLFFLNLKFESFEIRKSETESILIERQSNGLKINNEIELSDEEIKILSIGRIDRNMAEETSRKFSNVLNEMQSLLGRVRYIKEQRLIDIETNSTASRAVSSRRYSSRLLHAVNSIPRKFEDQIRSLDSKYSQLSTELDRTFLKRLFDLKDGIGKLEFDAQINQMRKKIKKLSDSGIARIGTLDVTEFKKEDARALKIYFEDFGRKYQIYEKMIEQIELFKKIVDTHFLFKHLEITDGKNIEIIDNDTGEKIRLDSLSSGEQEILVLYYRLLFEIPEETIVLIDEPEISLHIAWQRMFVNDLKKIAELKNIFAIVATHSMQIVSGNRNIQYDLGEMYKNGLD